jgi:hypothetical protein
MREGAQSTGTEACIDTPELDEVKAEDQGLVRDVIAVLSAIQHPNAVIKGWVVMPKTTFYEVVAQMDLKAGVCEISQGDMDLLKQLDTNRVSSSVRVTGAGGQVVVRVMKRSERVMTTEYDIIRVQKRARMWSSLWG